MSREEAMDLDGRTVHLYPAGRGVYRVAVHRPGPRLDPADIGSVVQRGADGQWVATAPGLVLFAPSRTAAVRALLRYAEVTR